MTDNAIIRRDGASAGNVQESSATISDSGTINIPTAATYDINGSPHTHAGLSTYDSDVIMQDITTNNADSDNHGFLPKLSGDSDTYLDGAGTWGTPSGSVGSAGLVFLEALTADSDATLDFESSLSSTYDTYVFKIIDLVPVTDSVDLYIQFSTDGGVTYDSSNLYNASVIVLSHAGSGVNGNAVTSPVAQIRVISSAEIGNDANWSFNGEIIVQNPNSSLYKQILGRYSYYKYNNVFVKGNMYGAYQNTTVIDAVRFYFSSGNIKSGTIRSYGVVKS